MAGGKIEEFQKAAGEAASFLQSQIDEDARIRIITHTDPDGLAAASILSRYFHSNDAAFHITFSKPLKTEEIAELANQDHDLFLFLDQGSGQLDSICKHLLNKGNQVAILDHHPCDTSKEIEDLIHINPHLYGLDGSVDVSASGVAYSVIRKGDKGLAKLSEIAIIGAVGDRQETSSGFSGINRKLIGESLDKGILEVKRGLKIIGRLMPLVKMLTLSIRPFLVGLSANEDACKELVEGLDLDANVTLEDLSPEDERNLRDAIIDQIGANVTEDFQRSIWGDIYVSKKGLFAGSPFLHEYVTILNACGEFNHPDFGFGSLLGDESLWDEASEIFGKYRKRMMEVLEWLASKPKEIKTTQNMHYLYAGERIRSKMIGEVLSLGIESDLLQTDRPIMGLADSEQDELKISFRASERRGGSHLGWILEKACKKVGGQGGGHELAAAARINRGNMDEFIARVDELLEEESIKSDELQ